jgi:RecA/RadA recombinase
MSLPSLANLVENAEKPVETQQAPQVVPSTVPQGQVPGDLVSRAAAPALFVKGTKDVTNKLLSALKRRRERNEEGGGSEYTRSSDRVLSAVKYKIFTGLKPLDEAVGGFPFSKIVELYGLDNSGKTALTMLICGAAKFGNIYEVLENGSCQKVTEPYDVTVLYIDNENSLEEGDRIVVYGQEVDCITGECDTTDKIFKDIETCCDEIEKIQKETKKLQFLVVAVDTIAGTSTRQEISADWAKQDYSRQPAMLRKGFRNIARRLKEQNVCLVCTNQVGDSFAPKSKMAGRSLLPQESDFSPSGGKALKYWAHVRIFIFKLPNPYKLAKGMFADGFVVHFFTTKNRIKMPLRSGRLVLLFKNALGTNNDGSLSSGGYSPGYSILEHLAYMKMITYASGSYNFNFAKYGIQAATGKTLQDEDQDEGTIKLESRLEWLGFYQKYQSQIDRLFDVCVEKMFAQNGAALEAEADEIDLEDLDSIDE